jgi:MFS family permease
MSEVRDVTEAEASQAHQSPLPWRFLGVLGIAVFGAAWGFLDIMAIAVVDGGESEGTVYAGAYLATTMVFTALTVPQVSRACDRLGDIAAFRLSKLGLVLAWGLAGILMLQGLTDEWLLLVFAPFFGALAGFSAVLNPLMASRLMGGGEMSRVFAVMSAVAGASWAVGALMGGWISSHVAQGWGVLAAGLATIPFALLSIRPTPTAETAKPLAGPSPAVSTWQMLRSSPELRTAVLLGAALACVVAPVVSLVVPISDELFHQNFILTAGVMMASLSVGEAMAAPLIKWLRRAREDLPAARICGLGCGFLLLLFAADVYAFGDRLVLELIFWVIISLAFGACFYSARALSLGAAVSSGAGGDASRMISVFLFAATVAAPLGVLGWSMAIEYLSVRHALSAAALATLAVLVLLFRQTKTTSGQTPRS